VIGVVICQSTDARRLVTKSNCDRNHTADSLLESGPTHFVYLRRAAVSIVLIDNERMCCRFLSYVVRRIRWTRDHCPTEWRVGRKVPLEDSPLQDWRHLNCRSPGISVPDARLVCRHTARRFRCAR